MHCEDNQEDSTSQTLNNLNNLDSALHELGMLSTITNSRNQYLQEMRRKSFGSKPNVYIRKQAATQPDIGMVHMNSKYVSSVALGSRKRRFHSRPVPYIVPERSRTKSENSDSVHVDPQSCLKLRLPSNTWTEEYIYFSAQCPNFDIKLKSGMKSSLQKSKSLEDIRVENINASQLSHEMEFVSSRIQKLKVME